MLILLLNRISKLPFVLPYHQPVDLRAGPKYTLNQANHTENGMVAVIK